MKYPLHINAATWLVLLAVAFLAPLTVAHAANITSCPPGQLCYTPLEPLPGVGGKPLDESGAPGSFGALLTGLFRILISLGGLLAVLTLVIGGITYMVSDAIDKKDYARKRIRNSLWGLLLLISSVLILNTVNPQLLNFNFRPSGSSSNAGGTTAPPTVSGLFDLYSSATTYTCYANLDKTGPKKTITMKNSDLSTSDGRNTLDAFESQCPGVVAASPASL